MDSTAVYIVIKHIKEIAKTGIVVVLTIHQPSMEVFSILDDIVLLSTNGTLAFSGSITAAQIHFSKLLGNFPSEGNVADILIEAVSNSTSSENGLVNSISEQPKMKRYTAEDLSKQFNDSTAGVALQSNLSAGVYSNLHYFSHFG